MHRLSDKLAMIIMTFWVGGLWVTSAWAYVLFQYLSEDRHLAGQIAGEFFNIMAYVGMGAAAYLLLHRLFVYGTKSFKQSYFWAVFFMLCLVLAGHYGIQPILAQLKIDAMPNDVMSSVFASRFSTWHGVASVAYVMQCLLGLVVVLKVR